MPIQLSGSLAVTGSVSINGTNVGGFAKSFILGNNTGLTTTDNATYASWVATAPVTASAILGLRTTGTGALVCGSRNGTALVATPLSITTTNTFVSTSVLTNQCFNTGDVLGFGLVSTTGTVCRVTIQVSFCS